MYYILNETDQIIAADDNLLSLCSVSDISGLSSNVEVGETTFTSQDEESVTINTNTSEQTYAVSKTLLSSTLGHITLVELGEEQTNDVLSDELFLDPLDDTEDVKFESLDANEEISFDIPTDESDSDLFEINETVEEESTPEVKNTLDEADEPFDLLGESTESLDLDVISEDETKEDGEIIVDIVNISQTMGISDEDYTIFLNEYIDTALALEEDLQSDDAKTRNNAIMTLTDLSEIMHLPDISSIMENIHASTPDQQKGYIGYLYTTLSRLTTESSSNEAVETEDVDSDENLTIAERSKAKAEPNPNSFGIIDLSDVKAKHFDFQLEEAANDLSLPVELIEEFVHDFIEQAQIETKKMLEAYEEGDLEKIQAIGHLLKGASSNLRINALSDTLYKIQFCENENGLDDLIKDYWAHFLSFEHQIDVISN